MHTRGVRRRRCLNGCFLPMSTARGDGARRPHLCRPCPGRRVQRHRSRPTGLGWRRWIGLPASGAAHPSPIVTPRSRMLCCAELEHGALPDFRVPPQREFFQCCALHLQEGLFADPAYGGNCEKQGWRFLGHPGVWFENSAEENLATEPVTKGGMIQALERRRVCARRRAARADRHTGLRSAARRASRRADRRTLCWSASGRPAAQAAAILARAGLRVVGLEAGPWRTRRDFVPDELGSAYYCRGEHGAEVSARNAALAAQRTRADPRGDVHPRAHDERRRRLGHPLGWRLAPLPSAPLQVPELCARAVGRAGAAGGPYAGRLAVRL